MTMLTRDEHARYARHLVLPEFGEAGQERLKRSSVLIVGAGGLGSPAVMYLAAAGVGTIGVADGDVVELSNLQRQVIHRTEDIGRRKTATASATIASLNPFVHVRTHNEILTSGNALDVLSAYDVILDCTDNFPTRYLLNDASVFLKKPLVYGSVFRFEGQVSVFDARRGPCYRCLYPEPPRDGQAQNCAEAGVLGVLPGIIGTFQAAEAIKILSGVGEPLIGRLLLFDIAQGGTFELNIDRQANCPVCGDHPTITQLIDYEAFCSNPQRTEEGTMIKEMTVQELKRRMDNKEDIVLVDVRQQDEHAFANIGGILIPTHEFAARMKELDPSKEIVVYCRSGSRSASVVRYLDQNGFTNAKNLKGGILEWSRSIDPTIPTY